MSSFPNSPPSPPPSAKPSSPIQIHHRSSPNSRPGSPLYRIASPYRAPSPYNASRPRPRKGFVDRVRSKLRLFLRTLREYARQNPVKMGLLAVLPAVVVGGGLVSLVGTVGRGIMGFLSGSGDEEEEEKTRKVAEQKKNEDPGVFGHFVSFGGCKPEWGPRDGILKLIQMMVNHWCKLSPSGVPRLASILLELYFLENIKIM